MPLVHTPTATLIAAFLVFVASPVRAEGYPSGSWVPALERIVPASAGAVPPAGHVAFDTDQTVERDADGAIEAGADPVRAEVIDADAETSAGGRSIAATESSGPKLYYLEIRRTERSLEISGSVPDQLTRDAILASASSAVTDLPMTIALVEKPGAPAGFELAAVQAAGLMRLLADGGFALNGKRLVYTGTAFHAGAKNALKETAESGLPPGYDVDLERVAAGPVGPPIAASECEDSLATWTARHPIAFEAGRADIMGDSGPLIDRVAYIAARCPDALIAVAGHTDSDGTDEANFRLSLDRARAVVDLLVAAGIPEGRFTALGYGESRPLRSNATSAGKARNRRIEFVLRVGA